MLILSKDLYFRRVDLAKIGFVTSQGERSVYFVKKALVIRVFLYRISERTYV